MRRRRVVDAAGIAVGAAATVGFGYLAVRDVDLALFRRGLAGSDWRWLVPALAALAAAVLLRALRWQLLFAPRTRPPLGAVTASLLVGYFFNQLLPARAGEAARVLALHRRAGSSRAEAAGTAVTERIYDVLSLLLLLLVAAPFLPDVGWIRRAAVVAVAFGLMLGLVVVVVLRFGPRPLAFALRPLARVPGLSRQRTDAIAANTMLGLAALHRPRLALPALVVTLVSWLVLAGSSWFCLQAVAGGLGYGAGVLTVVSTNLALVIPSGPAAAGVFEAAVLLALDPFGVGPSHALAAAVVLHGLNLFPFLLAGIWVLKPRMRRGSARVGVAPDARVPERRALIPATDALSWRRPTATRAGRRMQQMRGRSDLEGNVTISVVIPCLNEEQGVGAVIDAAWEGIHASGLPGEVVVVDNASTDRSAEVADAHGARVVFEAQRGYGSAYLAGLAAARGDYIVMADADGTYPIGELDAFVRLLQEGNEMVVGSRFAGTIHRGSMPWAHRWIGNPILTSILNVFFGVKVSDAHCGMRALRKDALPRLDLQTTGMEFASEMIVKAARRKLRIAEVPINYYPRTGESKLNTFRDGWRHLRFMLVHSPTWLFMVPGFTLLLLGLIPLFALAGGPVSVFGRSWEIHTMIAGGTLTLVGAQIIQLGLFARTYAILYLGSYEPLFERLWRIFRLEYGLALGAAIFLAGGGLLAFVFSSWAAGGFGHLGYEYAALLGLTLAALGVQAVFASFFLSVLGLKKHLVLDRATPAAEATETVGAA